jgi:hypothetical protein
MPQTLYEDVSNMMFGTQEASPACGGASAVQSYPVPEACFGDDYKIMFEYVQKNPTSVEGHRMLRGAMHFLQFVALWGQDKNASVVNLFLAYCFHDRAVKFAFKPDLNGSRKLEGICEHVYKYVQRILTDTAYPVRLEALLVKVLIDICM